MRLCGGIEPLSPNARKRSHATSRRRQRPNGRRRLPTSRPLRQRCATAAETAAPSFSLPCCTLNECARAPLLGGTVPGARVPPRRHSATLSTHACARHLTVVRDRGTRCCHRTRESTGVGSKSGRRCARMVLHDMHWKLGALRTRRLLTAASLSKPDGCCVAPGLHFEYLDAHTVAFSMRSVLCQGHIIQQPCCLVALDPPIGQGPSCPRQICVYMSKRPSQAPHPQPDMFFDGSPRRLLSVAHECTQHFNHILSHELKTNLGERPELQSCPPPQCPNQAHMLMI